MAKYSYIIEKQVVEKNSTKDIKAGASPNKVYAETIGASYNEKDAEKMAQVYSKKDKKNSYVVTRQDDNYYQAYEKGKRIL